MSEAAPLNARFHRLGGSPHIATTPAALTHVELIWIENQIEHWIRFGDYVVETILAVNQQRSALSGMRIISQPRALRHFTAAFAPMR